MDKTPKAKISRMTTRSSSKTEARNDKNEYVVTYSTKTSTPTQSKRPPKNDINIDCSPILSQCTRENCDVDVVWDWNSPQSKTNCVRRTKRLHDPEQEKVPLKRTPSNHQLPEFGKLKEELEALKEQLANNLESNELFDENQEVARLNEGEFIKKSSDLEELFNDDSLEDQLVLCSQEIEKEFEKESVTVETVKCDFKINNDKKMEINSNKCEVQKVIVNTNKTETGTTKVKRFNFKNHIKTHNVPLMDIFASKECTSVQSTIESSHTNGLCSKTNNAVKVEKLADDSFELALATFKDEDIELLSQVPQVQLNPKQTNFKERSKCLETGLKTNVGSPQLRKTSSFDDSMFLKPTNNKKDSIADSLPKSTLEEIEKKRQQALAKLEAKKKQGTPIPVEEVSPIKCSPEEIEQKRLQALAKREAKRKEEIIERNRLEALKRLEMNKKKRLQAQNSCKIQNSLPRKITGNNR